MSNNRSAITGIITMRCPRCREGKMFPEGTLYTPRFMQMHDQCGYCGQSFVPEPGFYYGAMFVSYAISAAFFIVVWVAMTLLMEEVSLAAMIIALLLVVIGLMPVTFRLSRALWIYIFVRYDKRYRKNGSGNKN